MKIDFEKQVIDYSEKGILRMGPMGSTTAGSTSQTLNSTAGKVERTGANIAAAGEEALTIASNKIKAGAIVLVSVIAATGGTPIVGSAVVSAGQVIVTVSNVHATVATTAYTIGFLVINPD